MIRELGRCARHYVPRWAGPVSVALAAAVGFYLATYEFWVTTEQHRTFFHRIFPS